MWNWIFLFGTVIVLSAVVGVCVAVLIASFPEPENRPMPLERQADLEAARDAALQKLAARARRQDEREASARISRGF